MDINKKLKILDAIYDLHESYIKDINFACKKFCNYCCTCNLTTTTLEVYKILSSLNDRTHIILNKLYLYKNKDRFVPSVTVNKMAELCSRHENIPEENINYDAGSCVALSKGECSIYNARPFGCRSMLSISNCGELGYANIDPYLLTVHNVFIQYIEHIDVLGYISNFTDVLLALNSKSACSQYEKGVHIEQLGDLIQNQFIHTLMIPPEHKERIQPLLSAIRNIKV